MAEKWNKKLQNIVFSVTLGVNINLNEFSKKVTDIVYDNDRFPGAIYKMTDPKVSALIFSSGKANCTGVSHWDQIPEVMKKLEKKFKEGGVSTKNMEIKIQNLVVSADLGYRVNIDTLVPMLDNVEYEPEQFPGLIYRVADPKCVVLIFTSGKVNVVGARKWEHVDLAIGQVDKDVKEIGAILEQPP